MNSYLNPGLAGSFANLHAKNAFEIPMQVLLPSGCDRVRPTISGTDIDGIREVNGKIAIYEAKNETAKFNPAQFSVLVSLLKRKGVDFIVLSRWNFYPLPEQATNKRIEHLKENGYENFAIPFKAAIFCKDSNAAWLESYLLQKVGNFNSSVYDQSEMIHRYDLNFPEYIKDDYIMVATPEWNQIAWLIDAYAEVCA